jgi:hypothetical protein
MNYLCSTHQRAVASDLLKVCEQGSCASRCLGCNDSHLAFAWRTGRKVLFLNLIIRKTKDSCFCASWFAWQPRALSVSCPAYTLFLWCRLQPRWLPACYSTSTLNTSVVHTSRHSAAAPEDTRVACSSRSVLPRLSKYGRQLLKVSVQGAARRRATPSDPASAGVAVRKSLTAFRARSIQMQCTSEGAQSVNKHNRQSCSVWLHCIHIQAVMQQVDFDLLCCML